jgi:hypothetical protein
MKAILWSLVVWSFAGCMEMEGSPELGATEQAVTTPWVTTHSCATGACTDMTISGSGASVCFITELDGDLAHEGSARIHKGFGSVWFLDILSPNNNNIQVRTACINLRGTDPQTLVRWSSQSQHNPVFHGTANTRCFLSEVTANNTAAFTTFDNNFFIANQQPGPFDYMVLGAFPSSPGANVTIGMECFATPSLLAGLAYGNGSPNPVNNTLLTGADAQGAVCGLTGLGGLFSTPSTLDGIRTYKFDTSWGWEASGWKGIWGQCVR